MGSKELQHFKPPKAVGRQDNHMNHKHGKQFQAQHLTMRLRLAQERANEEAVGKIVAIIQPEKQRSFWQQLNYVTGKK